MDRFNIPEFTLPTLIGEVLPTVADALIGDCQFVAFYGDSDAESEKNIRAAATALKEVIGDYLDEQAEMLIRFAKRTNERELLRGSEGQSRTERPEIPEEQAEQLRKLFQEQHAKRYRL